MQPPPAGVRHAGQRARPPAPPQRCWCSSMEVWQVHVAGPRSEAQRGCGWQHSGCSMCATLMGRAGHKAQDAGRLMPLGLCVLSYWGLSNYLRSCCCVWCTCWYTTRCTCEHLCQLCHIAGSSASLCEPLKRGSACCSCVLHHEPSQRHAVVDPQAQADWAACSGHPQRVVPAKVVLYTRRVLTGSLSWCPA